MTGIPDDVWQRIDPGLMAGLDRQLAESRALLREEVDKVAQMLATDPDPAHAMVRLGPAALLLPRTHLAGAYALALLELAEAKRRGAWT